jgi:hypothetical protein
MQVNCPNCGEKLTAANINVQKMTAVCGACDTVFTFEPPEVKAKRRKVKQPTRLTLRDADTLQMEFRTNFRLDRNEVFLISTLGGTVMGALSALLLSEDAPIILTMMFVLTAAALFYAAALSAFNKTHIEMDEDVIRVTRTPIPNPLNLGDEVSLASVTAIKYAETEISKTARYDTPRYRVWAQTDDGTQRTIVNDVIEEYAVFIAQHLQERLQMNGDVDVSRLEDVEQGDANVDGHEEAARTSSKNG